MRVLAAGGNGFIGKACVRAMMEAGHTVRVLARTAPAQPRVAAGTGDAAGIYAAGPHGSELIVGDLGDPASLARAAEGCDALVHTVGVIIEPRGVSYEKVVVEGTRNLVAAAKAAGIRRMVFVSALGTRADAPSRYHRTKWQAEEMIRASGIPYTILRPSIVYGPGDGFLSKFLAMPFVPLPGGGGQKYQPIYVEDLAALVARCLTDPAAENQTVDAGGPETMTFAKMMSTVLIAAKSKKLLVSFPMWYMALLALASDPMQKLFPPLAIITRDQYKMLHQDNTGDPEAIRRLFPDLHLRTLSEGLAEYMA